MICSNCKAEYFKEGLTLRTLGLIPTLICPACLTGALVLQVTVRRETAEVPFKHQCFQVLEATDEAAELPGVE
jgi:hypothetical protein